MAPETEFDTVAAAVARHAATRPDSLAVADEARELNWREFDALVDRVAAALQRDGVKPRDAIAICALSAVAYLAPFLGALRAGVAVAPLAPSARRRRRLRR